MDIKEAIKKKAELEDNILDLIKAFHDETGAYVDSLYVENVTTISPVGEQVVFQNVTVEAKI